MHNQCKDVGSSRCMMVYYEQLVLHPSESMHKILEFLDVPWNESVLHHEEQINKPGGVSLSKYVCVPIAQLIVVTQIKNSIHEHIQLRS